jgi:Tfp pilus assembly protein PilN
MLGRAFRWWRSALGEALMPRPAPFAAGSVRLRPAAVGFLVLGPDGAATPLGGDGGVDRAVQRQVVRAQRRYLDLDEDVVLDVRGTLPAAAASDPREAVGLRMQEFTPFDEDEVLFDLASVAPAGEERLSFRALVTPRAPVLDQIEALRRQGIRIDGVVATDGAEATGSGVPDFMPAIAARRLRWAATGLGLSAGLLVLALGWLWVESAARQERERKATLAAIETLLGELRRAGEIEAEIARLSVALVGARERREAEVPVLDLLESIARALPDEIHLESFGREGGEVVLSGHAPDATAVIGLLEASDLLSRVRFTAPVARDQRAGLDRFSVMAVATPPRAEAPR